MLKIGKIVRVVPPLMLLGWGECEPANEDMHVTMDILTLLTCSKGYKYCKYAIYMEFSFVMLYDILRSDGTWSDLCFYTPQNGREGPWCDEMCPGLEVLAWKVPDGVLVG